MDISTIATDEYVEVDPSERASKIRSIFERDRPRGVLVTEDEEVRGVIGQQQLIRSHLEDTTQAHALMRSAPTLTTDTDVREVARLLVEGDVKVAPVEDDSNVVGIVSIDAILQAVLPNLAAIDVEDIYTTAVTTIDDGAHLGRAINLFREGGISRLPVTDAEEGTLVGILTTVDILDFVTRREHRQGRRDRRGDLDRMLDLPVYDLMSAPVEQVSGEATVEEAVRQMFDAGFSGLVVTDAAERVAGIITKTDVLRALKDVPGCKLARMSGSGATCFGIFASIGAAQQAAQTLARKRPGWFVKATLTIPSPQRRTKDFPAWAKSITPETS
jgi:predicted transcriptional regulator